MRLNPLFVQGQILLVAGIGIGVVLTLAVEFVLLMVVAGK